MEISAGLLSIFFDWIITKLSTNYLLCEQFTSDRVVVVVHTKLNTTLLPCLQGDLLLAIAIAT